MDKGVITLNRWLVGILTLACLVASLITFLQSPDRPFWWGGFLRAAIVLGTLWICLPTQTQPAAWANFRPMTAALVLGVLLLAVIRPRIGLPILLGILAIRALFTRRRR